VTALAVSDAQAFFDGLSLNNRDAQITVSAELIGYRKVDKLFTSFAFVPVIQMTKGIRKLDAAKGFVGEIFGDADTPERIMKGMCHREYEVGIGYHDTEKLLTKHLQAACAKRDEELPEPVILTSNAASGMSYGTYSQIECDEQDLETGVERASWKLIRSQLERDNQWNRIVEHSQQALGGFMRVYCPIDEEVSS